MFEIFNFIALWIQWIQKFMQRYKTILQNLEN